MVEGDARVQALQAAQAAEPVILRPPAANPASPQDFVTAINALWGRAQQSFLDIGRLLIQAKEMLPHGTYTDAVEANLPFSANTAYQLREAARWVMNGQIPQERLPSNYTTIYQLSTLPPPLLDAAAREGVIRPNLTRTELRDWKRRMSQEADRRVADRRVALGQKLARLRSEAARIADQIAKAEAEMAVLAAGGSMSEGEAESPAGTSQGAS
jgi:hypothetical protein